MKIQTETLAYITPDKGQTVLELSKEIAEAKESKKIGDKVFLNLPNGKSILVEGKTTEEIRDSIMTKWEGNSRF
jgi:uncharacterized FAD-dependent dehydrogenase